MKEKISLFITGFTQVLLVAANTYLISHEKYVAVLLVGFLISMVWSWNVKKIAFGSTIERVIYSSGAGIGALSGLLLVKLFY